VFRKLRSLLDSSSKPMAKTATNSGRGTLFNRSNRRVSTYVAMLATALMVVFGGVAAIAATPVGNIVITTSNSNPPVNGETQANVTDAGVPGDTIVITSNFPLTGPVNVVFSKADGTSPTTVQVPGPAATFSVFSVTIPAGAASGMLAIHDAAAHDGYVSPFAVWVSHSEPYVMPAGHLNVTYGDLKYILDQIKIGEAHAARTSNATIVKAGAMTVTAAGTPRAYNAANASSLYPYDVLSATRCLQAVDITTAATANATYGTTGLSNAYVYNNLDPWGVRQVDGECNNITNVTANAPATYSNTVSNKADTAGWGASDQFFSRLSAATNKPGVVAPYTLNAVQKAYSNPTSYVKDASPRVASNLISDQSSNNPAAVAASNEAFNILYGTDPNTEVSVNASNTSKVSTVMQIPDITSDYNVSAGYNSWFTLFGQFFDHGLDLIPKGGSQVFIPLDQSDPLYSTDPTSKNYMILTRGSDSTGEQINITSPWVDQSQTYGSVASQNFFLREYKFTGAGGAPVATGRLIEGTNFYDRGGNQTLGKATAVPGEPAPFGVTLVPLNGGLGTWWDIKNQAYRMGFNLTDWDAKSIPIIATNQYGKFIPGPNGFPMMLFKSATNQYIWVEGNKNAPISTFYDTVVNGVHYGNTDPRLATYTAVSSGHNFINDTMGSAVPNGSAGNMLIPDADSVINAPGSVPSGYYDNESLNEHFVAGDGRVNENIGLSAVHNTFHSEHNLLANDIEIMLQNNPAIPASFLAEFLTNKTTITAAADAAAGNWDGDRVYQASRYIAEMEYQHMVYDEFVRRISPGLPVFLAYQPTTRADISQEFASAVYRLGHSMLNETIARSNPGTTWDPNNNQDVSLVTGFTNPSQARLLRPIVIASASVNGSGTAVTYTVQSGESVPDAGSVISVSGLDVGALNLQNAVVDAGASANSFTVSSTFKGGANASATALSGLTANATSISLKYDTTSAANYLSTWTTKEPKVSSRYVLLARASISNPGGSGYTYTPGQSAAAIAQGMSQQRGNEIDEFTTDAVRNNLLGLPLDLPSLNITRGRDTGLPTLNQFRATTGGSLKPYKSWNDFVAALRYPASAVNFVAAYGTDASITTKVIGGVTKVTSGASSSVYTSSDITNIHAGDVVSISGFTGANAARFNLQNAIVGTVTPGVAPAGTFTVTKYYLSSPSAPTAFVKGASVGGVDAGMTNLLKDVTPQNVVNVGTATATLTKAAVVSRDTTQAERRIAAQALVDGTNPTGPAFMASTGVWAAKETGFNNIDLWLGGLAENPAKQPLTPPMLGPTFQYVFDKQTLALQNGDRFYYLGRILGTNLNEEIPAQKLTDIVRRNTPSLGNSVRADSLPANSGIVGMNSPGFGVGDCFFSPTVSIPTSTDNSQGGAPTKCDPTTMRADTTNNVLIHDGLDNVVGFGNQYASSGIRISGGAGDDSLQGTAGNDFLSGGVSGGDLIDGYSGDDILFGGPGEDLMKGGAGNDVLDMGESQAGDIADGGSGSDFIHNSNSTGIAASAIGEAGDDYIQGGTNNDILLEGGEGSDWIEGNGGLDIVNGDAGPNAALVDMPNGGDDVIDGGAGNDLLNGDGGDDVFNLGDGTDGAAGATGFDWVNYEHMTRFDNGQTTLPSAFLDLSALIPNPTLLPGDAAADIEGMAGSTGNDVLMGRQAQNQILPSTATPINANTAANTIYGKAGQTWITLAGTNTTIDGGMLVSGNGIPTYSQTVGAGVATTTAAGVTTTQINLTYPLTANVTGNVTFKVWPLKRSAAIQGLTSLVAGTPGTMPYAAVPAAGQQSAVPATTPGEWTGGTIIAGGAGNDSLYAMGGSNVIHGSVALHTCIVVTHNGAPFDTNSDTVCDGRNGYSGMTPLLTFMNSGVINPKDLRVVKEFDSTAQQITSVNASGSLITYTVTKNTYNVGDLVTVNGLANATWNVNRVAITAADATSFTVSAAATATVGPVAAAGTAVQSDDLYLPGLVANYTIERLSTLPLGATSGFKITGPSGIDYAYDVQRIVFDSIANAAPTPLVLSNNPASANYNTGLAVGATSFGITAGQLILSPAFNPAIHNYTAIASGPSVTTVPAGTGSIWVNGVAKRGATGTATSTTYTLTGGAGTLVYNFGTATTNTYTINILAGGLVSKFDEPQSTGDGFVTNITNCDKANFTYVAAVPGGTATIGSQIGNTCTVTVSGLAVRQASQLSVTATPAGFGANPAGVGTVVGMSSVGTSTPIVFDTPVGTNTGFTVNITSAVAGFHYTGTVIGTAGTPTVAIQNNGDCPAGVCSVTVTGMTATEEGLLTITSTRDGYPDTSNSVLGVAGGALANGLVSTVTNLNNNSAPNDGFNFVVSNYDSSFSYALSLDAAISTTGNVDIVDNLDGTATVTVNGLDSTEAAFVTITTSKLGFKDGSTIVNRPGGLTLGGVTPTWNNYVQTPDGFSFDITNYDNNPDRYVLTGVTAPAAVSLTSTSLGLATVTVTGLAPGGTATVNIAYTQPFHNLATLTKGGAALGGPALTPVLGTMIPTTTGFTFQVTNYDANYTWTPTFQSGAGTISAPVVQGATATYTVTGMTTNATAVVLMTTTRTNYGSGTNTLSGNAFKSGLTVTRGTTVKSSPTTLQIANFDPTFTYQLSWSWATPAGVTTNGAAANISMNTTGLITISVVPVNARVTGALVRVNVTTSKQYFTSVLTTFAF